MSRSWSWEVREWLLRPLTIRLDFIVAKDKDAVAQLKSLLDQGDKALAAVKANVDADEETDYEAIQPLVERYNEQLQEMNALAGVSNTVNPSQPVDANTGQNVPAPAPPTADTGDDDGSAPDSDNNTGTDTDSGLDDSDDDSDDSGFQAEGRRRR